MVFSSLTFLFLFLPVVLLGHVFLPERLRNTWLFVASVAFYAWGEGPFVVVMLGSILCTWLIGLLIELGRNGKGKRAALVLGLVVNVGLLASFKYANFFADTLNEVALMLGGQTWFHLGPVHLPIGISFFTFQAISYLIDVYRGNGRAERSLLRIACYKSMFPQLVAGPIVRYGQVAAEMRSRHVTMDDFATGINRFIVGLAKKILIANTMAKAADLAFASDTAQLSMAAAWLGLLAYTLQIYFDFSGYSDMAIGMGRMLGFRFAENFNHPYIARSVTDFWRRWHISLSTWFRDYLYIPLGGNRCRPWRVYINLAIVFVLCGLWHGASWNFVIWGSLHGGFLIGERALQRRSGSVASSSGAPSSLITAILRHAYTLAAVMLGWVFFRADTLVGAGSYLAVLAGQGQGAAVNVFTIADGNTLVAGLVAIVGSTPVMQAWSRRRDTRLAGRPETWSLLLARQGALFAIWWLCVARLVTGGYNPFIYFRF